MNAIILAAGMGRRLRANVPKCLLEIAGISLIKRQIAAFRAVGVKRFIIVVGYQHEQIRAHLSDDARQIHFQFVLNERFAETNTIYSLYLAREFFGSGFFFANGDVFFDERLPRMLLEHTETKIANTNTMATNTAVVSAKALNAALDGATMLAVKPRRCEQEEVKVVVGHGRVMRIGKPIDPACSLGEFIGVARFGCNIIPTFTRMLTQCIEVEGIVGDYFEQAIDRLCISGEPVLPVDIGQLPCDEIDFPEDLHALGGEIA